MVDAGGSDAYWPNGYKWALNTASMLADYEVTWFEEPLDPDALEDFVRLREHSPVRISGGEVLTRRQSFRAWLTSRAFDIVQPDVTKVGGISEERRIAWMAEDHGVKFVPHGWNTAVGLAADLHLASAVATTDFVEYLTGSPFIDEITDGGWKLDADGLDLGRLKRLSALVRYLPWAGLTEQSPSPTGKVVAQFVNSIRMGTDRVHAVVVKDAVNQLAQSQRELALLVSEVAAYQRERWKATFRGRALPRVPLDRQRPEAKREETLRALRRAVSENMPGSPFYPELAGEVLDEELSPQAEQLRARLLENLAQAPEAAPAPAPRRAPPQPDRTALLDAVRLLARSEAEMQSALGTLTANAERLAGPTRGLAGFVHRLLTALAGRREKERTLDVEYLDPDGTRHETVALAPFLESVKRKVELMASLGDESGQAFARLAAAADDQLLEFVERQLSDLLVLHRRMGGVNARLQAETPAGRSAGRRTEAKGIRLELSAIKNFLVKANQRMHDYTARLEELQQYQRSEMGAAPDGTATPGS